MQSFGPKDFELWYQPVYDMSGGAVIHNETLLRWRDKNGTLHCPQVFMPAIFSSGLEGKVDRLVLQKTAKTLAKLPQVSLSVNLSGKIIFDTQASDFIADIIHQYQINPAQIHLEIAEKSIAQNLPNGIALIEDLKQIGCTVILDNFANDYLTFSQWEKISVDSVKIRGDLVQHYSQGDAESTALIQAIVNAGISLGQTTVAKSIDVYRTSALLDQLQCDFAQGYHLKPPSPDFSLTRKIDMLGVQLDDFTLPEFLGKLEKGVVFTPNVDHLMNVRKQKEFGEAYSVADYKICDSQILYFASRFLGTPIREKISGSDLFPAFYQYHKDDLDVEIFLLGGMGSAARCAQRNINHKVGREIVIDAYSPPLGFDQDGAESLRIVDRINHSKATVLAIGVGAPKQEQWVSKYKDRLTHVKIIFAIGATIDFEAGLVNRAPQFVSNMGGEWLYRLMVEPQRLWKRYLVNDLPFVWLLLQQKIRG